MSGDKAVGYGALIIALGLGLATLLGYPILL